MNYDSTAQNRYANLAAHSGPSPVGAWLKAAFQRLVAGPAREPAPRDRVLEAADVRTWAESVRRTDPRFADDLFAAADRHEISGT